MSSWIFIIQRYQRRILSMRTNVVLPVWVPPPEVRPAAGLAGDVESEARFKFI